jgi:hypothetical protein
MLKIVKDFHRRASRPRPTLEEFFDRAFCPKSGVTDIVLIFPPYLDSRTLWKKFSRGCWW